MIRTSTMIGRTAAWVACLALGLGVSAQADTVIESNNVGGDAFNVNLGGGAANRRGEAVGSTGWYYNSVGGDATIGISSAQSFSPRSGNGSVLFQGVDGNSKADIEYFNSAAHTPPDALRVYPSRSVDAAGRPLAPRAYRDKP